MTDEEYVPSRRPELFDDPEQDPYRHEDLEEYPSWWTENINEFNRHGLRPYRPPRFADGELTTEVIQELSDDLGVDIRLRAVNPQTDKRWAVWIDAEPVRRIDRRRDGEGYTVYEIGSDEFRDVVRDVVER